MGRSRPGGGVDVVVVGLGAIGGAAALALARAGAQVMAFDPHPPPTPDGSSHGRSRITRRAYFEGPEYAPLLERSGVLLRGLEEEIGVSLVRRTGALLVGSQETGRLAAAEATARASGIPFEWLDPAEVSGRWPMLRLREREKALWEPDAGVIDAEAMVLAQLRQAARSGAVLRVGERVTGWTEAGEGVRVETSAGPVHADALVLAAGGWTGPLLRGVGLQRIAALFRVERQVLAWYRRTPTPQSEAPLPVLLRDREEGALLYAIPEVDGTLKAALHHGGEEAPDPAAVRRGTDPDDEARIAAPLRSLVQGLERRWARAQVCIYTNAPDGRHRIDGIPGSPRVILASGCSGHGFKTAPASGELAAHRALGIAPRVPGEPFSLEGAAL